ncbi:hypothetical protein [Kitasatospora sp. NPDC056731]|uniref:hypothetical protein n=1 Tax=Kitasatospora sp. NPDC056731 TaxID=3155422 RepID=UPI003440528E
MTRRRGAIAGVLAGAALLPLAACVLGRWESRWGGHGRVADALNRPLLMLGLTLGILLVAVLVRKRWDTIGLGAALVGGFALIALLAAAGLHAAGLGTFGRATEARASTPGRPDRVLVVVHDGSGGSETEAQYWKVRLESGDGWSARRWTLVGMRGRFPGDGAFKSARWTAPDRITVTTDTGAKVYAVDAESGTPTMVESTGNVASLTAR